jgi:hypothetical protein
MRGQSVLDVLEEDDLFISGRLSEGDDMNTIRCLSMHQRNANAFQEAERDKALFIIPKPIILEGERWASKDFLRISKVKAVTLRFVLRLASRHVNLTSKAYIHIVYSSRELLGAD